MKVLWFEATVPGRYNNENAIVSGWQDSLEYIVRGCNDIQLFVAFEGKEGMSPKEIDGVLYYPLVTKYDLIDRKFRKDYSRWTTANKTIPLALKCIEKIKPDIIQVFGSEWEFGQVAKYTDIPVVLHMQGCIHPYNNALYPPGYSPSDEILQAGLRLRKQFRLWKHRHFAKTWADMEQSNFKAVKYYMGRTKWDYQLVNLFHPGARYFHCNEALRPAFIENAQQWLPQCHKKLRLVTTGCSSHWKGMDMLLKTAHILKGQGVDFEWLVAGNMGAELHRLIEKKEHLRFEENNVNILGFTEATKLQELLLSSDIYVHTAYIENSPNSVCEAQYLGLPIISTNVGGISSLVEDGKGGVLVPANASENMAYEIVSLAKNIERQIKYSSNNKAKARERHDPKNILNSLLTCYKSIVSEKDPK